MMQTDTVEIPRPSTIDGGTAGQQCPTCGNHEFRTKTLIIDEQTGERPASVSGKLLGGIAVTLFGLVCFVLGLILVFDPLPSNVGNNQSPIYYIGMGLVVLWMGAALVKSSLGGKKVEVTRPECTVCWAMREQTRLFHQHRRRLAWANVLFVSGGFYLFAIAVEFIRTVVNGSETGVEQNVIALLSYTLIGGLFIFAAVALRRSGGRYLDSLLASAKADGDYYHCECGRPKYPFYWAHVAACFTLYGLVALFFPLKKCSRCRTPYYTVATSGQRAEAGTAAASGENTIMTDREHVQSDKPLYLYISPARLILLSIASFSVYEAYWIYKNWRYIKERDKLDIKPIWRGIFGVFYCHSLLHHIHQDKDTRLVQEPTFSAGGLATGWVILIIIANIVSRAPSLAASIIAAFIPSFLCLVPVQNYINAVTEKQNPHQKVHGWSSGHIVCLVLGVVIWALLLIGLGSEM